jgi:streptomycin 6-kinase
VTDGLGWARASAEGRAWLERLPEIVEACAEQWSLTLEAPFPLAGASLAIPATTREGRSAVLKVCFPHRESEHEAHALRAWDGNGAVRLLAHDPERWTLLIERCVPGRPLAGRPEPEVLETLCALLPRLWLPGAPPFRELAEEALWWVSYLPHRWDAAGQPFERSLLDVAVEALQGLRATQGEQVLLHQDLHPGNVLSAEREPWLVIDPKPVLGEREFAIAPIVRAFELEQSARAVTARLDRLSGALGLDRDRARLWALGQTIAWSLDSEYHPDHVEIARLLLHA